MTFFRSLAVQCCFCACCVAATARGQAVAADFAELRAQMVADEIEASGVADSRVLAAMRSTPRHEFVPAKYREYAYFDAALPIGDRQTISPPFVVAYMTEQLDPQLTDRVLEIGSGSGYQAAVLSSLVAEVYTIEIVESLGLRAQRTLRRLGYDNVFTRIGDGYAGWPEKAPFDKIIVTCSPEDVPEPLIDQLKEGGQMIVPVGQRYQQNLFRLTKRDGKLEKKPLRATLFVPMTGAAEEQRDVQPDPAKPSLVNGGFELRVAATDDPVGWHYLRGAVVMQDSDAPEGENILRFASRRPGQASRALQGLAIDGRQIHKLRISMRLRGDRLASGPADHQQPGFVITFYDQRRAVIGSQRIGPWEGSFDWRQESREIAVPLATRESIVRLGLHGGRGTLDVDDVRLAPIMLP